MIYIDDVLYEGAIVATFNTDIQVNLLSRASFSELEETFSNARKVTEKNSAGIELKNYFLRGLISIERQGTDRTVLTFKFSPYEERTAEQIALELNELSTSCSQNNAAIAGAVHSIGENTNEINSHSAALNVHTNEIQENTTGIEDQLIALFEIGDLINDLERRVQALEGGN